MTSKLLAVLLIILLCAPDFAVAQTGRPLKPSPDLFAADIDKLIADLKAGKTNASQIASAEALSNFSKVNGLMGALSPTVESFIEASANHDYAAGRDFLAK